MIYFKISLLKFSEPHGIGSKVELLTVVVKNMLSLLELSNDKTISGKCKTSHCDLLPNKYFS